MKKIYVGMGLTQAPKEFREDFQNELKANLRNLSEVEVLDFIGLVAGTPTDVYDYDRSHTESAELCVFIVDYPSIGLGMEISIRLASGKKMLIFAHVDAKITRMLTGMCEKEGVSFVRYETVDDIVEKTREVL